MRNFNKKAGVALLAAAALGLSACGSDSAVQDGELVIGRILPLSGALAPEGSRVQRGMDLAVEIWNEKGGVDGNTIRFETVDAPDDAAARSGAERLVNQDISIFTGTFGSSLALAAIPVVDRAGGLYWETGASATNITVEGQGNVFRFSSDARDLGVDAIDFAKDYLAPELGVDASELTVGWAGVNNSYGQDVLAAVKEKTSEYGMDFILESAYPLDSTDLSSVALQIRDADPDILVLTNYDGDAAILGRAMRSSGVEPDAIIGTGAGHVNSTWPEAMSGDANGYFNVGFSPAVNPEGLAPEAQELWYEFQTKYAEKYNGEAPGSFDVNGFAGMVALLTAMENAGELTVEGISEAARQLDLPTGSMVDGAGLKFDETGQNVNSIYHVSQWQEGKVLPVYPLEFGLAEPIDIPLPAWGER